MTSLRLITLLLCISAMLCVHNPVCAQDKSVFIYAFATGFFDGKEHVAMTPLYSDQFEGGHISLTPSWSLHITNQLNNQLKIDFPDRWFKFNWSQGRYFDTRGKAVEDRQKVLANYSSNGYVIHYVNMPYVSINK